VILAQRRGEDAGKPVTVTPARATPQRALGSGGRIDRRELFADCEIQ